jgi:hypothetical protein
MTYIEIEPTLVYCWEFGNKITTIYVDHVGSDPLHSMRASTLIQNLNNGVWGWIQDASFNREEAVKELRKKIRREYDAATKKVARLARQYEEAK